MTELVDPEVIESVVGMTRHDTIHFGRAVTTDERFYILHSRECRDDTADVRDCPFSLALDHGIMGVPGVDWATDTLLVLSIANDKLTTYQSWVLQDRGVFYPFVEDEDANITGLGHQDPETFAAAINIGPNPTFGEKARKIEVHMIGFQGSIYGEPLEVSFLNRLRDVISFSDVEALKKQLDIDVQTTIKTFDEYQATRDL